MVNGRLTSISFRSEKKFKMSIIPNGNPYECLTYHTPAALTSTPLWSPSLHKVRTTSCIGTECQSRAPELSDVNVIPKDTGMNNNNKEKRKPLLVMISLIY